MIQFNAPERLTIDNFTKVTEKEIEVLSLLLENLGYTTTYIANKLSLNRKTVSLRIKSLKKYIIVRIGSDKKRY
ncbi:helix-turn-helix transcriptional regulator [Thomasclavelia cocleata]|jgi:ATP-dependent DNA helicase RecG|uniref:helix-turn-helix transcriptional regulator n=1 Tax=Thomasclavelia cocleata TaxID=69824 RepID=UPI00241BEC16|nr:hypothetical protein [Thomasclavelia cocleata]